MDEYLAKPLQVAALFGAITRLLAEPADATPASVSDPPASSLQPPASSPEAPFNKAELLERVGGDVGLMREIVGLFLEEGPMHMTEIREAIDRGDTPALTKAAHTLKGAVGVFGARKSAEAALRLEQRGRAGDLVQTGEGFRHLEEAMTILMPALEALMQEEGESPCGF
jgi:HPt (histidine-containing phosphotransfer) domain-containing protein